ncbi:MAG: PepSY-associated TM helix domain-containing protein [Alphaproteobacteria bacterium]
MAEAAATALASNSINRRLTFVRWVRRTHGWFGLWGALLGLMMGFSGVWLNHRNVMKLQLPSQQQLNAQLELPDPRPASIDALAAWLQQTLKLDRPANNQRVERARPVAWAEKGAERGGEQRPLTQPERWTLNFGGPNHVVQVEYWVGNKSVGVRTPENGFIATLTNLHKGVGMPVPWILLIDTLAGSLIFLSISGAILWWETHRRRGLGIAIFGVSVVVTVALAVAPLQL